MQNLSHVIVNSRRQKEKQVSNFNNINDDENSKDNESNSSDNDDNDSVIGFESNIIDLDEE